MAKFRARVENGRLILDEPTALPEGTLLDLVVDDEGDDLGVEDRRALHDALRRSSESVAAGRVLAGSKIIDKLRERR
jgi:hypothetical protein